MSPTSVIADTWLFEQHDRYYPGTDSRQLTFKFPGA